MNTIYSDNNENYRVGQIDLFLEIAMDSYKEIIKFNSETRELLEDKLTMINPIDGKSIDLRGFDHLDRLFYIQNENFKQQINGILSLSTFFEGLVNEIGQVEFGSTYFNEHLDKLSILSKWEVVTRIAYGKSLPTDLGYYEPIKKLISARNKLAHYKTKVSSKESHEFEYDRILIACIESLPSFIAQLKILDESIGAISFHAIDKCLEGLSS